ncbi:MAG: hypothetical protein U0984_06155, partial [Prosthecobacter sp.]|nr:hypothetical protein [Prosthecobacter sp.]
AHGGGLDFKKGALPQLKSSGHADAFPLPICFGMRYGSLTSIRMDEASHTSKIESPQELGNVGPNF